MHYYMCTCMYTYQGLVGDNAVVEGEATGLSSCDEHLRRSGTSCGWEEAMTTLPDLPTLDWIFLQSKRSCIKLM